MATNKVNQTGRNRILVSGAEQALERFKYEIANELGLDYNGDKGNLTSRQNGYVGGLMVRRMIEQAETQLANGGNLGGGANTQA
ncbi:MAG: alpha/beta-type small acid-soluble spore protein [Firmicutes bacterium]|nr:alpha/beta-type small acid-soluble spore protein [Bacillota bacterium]